MAKKKVLEIITLAGSAEAFIGDQFSFFQKEGDYEMHLICSYGKSLDDFARKQGIKYKVVEISRKLAPIKDLKAVIEIARYIRKNNIDIIVAHYFVKSSLLANCANLLAGNKTKVMIAHGVLQDTMHGLKRKLVIWEQKFDVLFAKKVICVSPSVARRRREDGIDSADQQVILGKGSCNGVDAINKFNPDNVPVKDVEDLKLKFGLTESDIVIGFSGRLVRDKGIIELSQAFCSLKERHLNKSIKLLIIGEKEKRDAVPQEVLGVLEGNPDVIFTGRVDYSEIQKYYLLMDVLVLPSYREGFPTVVLESSAMGIPAIVSKSTGCIDSIQEGVTGIYTDITSESIVRSIEFFFDKEITKKMGKNARKNIMENYDQRIIRKYMLDVLNSL